MEFLLWVIGIYLFVVVVLPRLFRWMLLRRVQKIQKEGKTTINTDSATQSRHIRDDVGEYVEYEEVTEIKTEC